MNMISSVRFMCVCLLAVSLVVSAEDEQLATLCFGNDDTSKELYINCGSRAVVYLINATYSIHQEAVLSTCPYQKEPSDCWLSPTRTTMQHMLDRCMGHHACTVQIVPQPIDACDKLSNLFQVAYQCIPDKDDTQRYIMDICGDEDPALETTHSTGYIKSPRYPDNYSPDTSCNCFLNATTTNEAVRLHFSILDVDISAGSNPNWASDWLEYVSDIKDWADGDRFNDAQRVPLGTSESDWKHGYINFLTDNSKEGRGFWIKYEGITSTGKPVPVQIKCGRYNPPEQRVAITCMPPGHGGELYLDCRSQGVINIIGSRHGSTTLQVCPSDGIKGDLCAVTDSEQSVDIIRDRCMGQTECHVSVSQIDLPTCILKSNYAQSVYECVERDSLVDICGDNMGGAPSIERTNGYIESLSYPELYSPDTNCTCVLSSTEEHAQIMLYVLDMMLAPRTLLENDPNPFPSAMNDCQNDYLEYNLNENIIGNGIKLCGKAKQEPISIEEKSVYLNFISDGTNETRGFWIRYAGQLPGGHKSPLQIKCHANLPQSQEEKDNEIPQDGEEDTLGESLDQMNDETEEEKDEGQPKSIQQGKGTDIGLVIGLCLTALLVMILAFAMVVYKRSRGAANKPEDTYLSRDRPQGGLESGDSPFKYSSFSSPGQLPYQASSTAPLSSHDGKQGDPLPDYDYGPQQRKLATTPYMNQAFDNEDCVHPNV